MQIVTENTRANTLRCRGLGQVDLLDTSECCETCHSAESHVPGYLGPCRVVLADGRAAFVCCAAKKQLLGEASL